MDDPADTTDPATTPGQARRRERAAEYAEHPPRRFIGKHRSHMTDERRHPLKRVGVVAIGLTIAAAGVVLMPLPGPGWVVFVAGLGVLARESSKVARLLDWGEHRMWRTTNWWYARRGM